MENRLEKLERAIEALEEKVEGQERPGHEGKALVDAENGRAAQREAEQLEGAGGAPRGPAPGRQHRERDLGRPRSRA